VTTSNWSKKDCPDQGLTRKDQKVNQSKTSRIYCTLGLFIKIILTSYTENAVIGLEPDLRFLPRLP